MKSEHFNLESHGREKSVTSHTHVEAVPSLAKGYGTRVISLNEKLFYDPMQWL